MAFTTKGILAFLKARQINDLISAKLTQALQQAIVDKCQWLQVAPGLEVSQLLYTPHAWAEELGAPAFGRAAPAPEAQRAGCSRQDVVAVCR